MPVPRPATVARDAEPAPGPTPPNRRAHRPTRSRSCPILDADHQPWRRRLTGNPAEPRVPAREQEDHKDQHQLPGDAVIRLEVGAVQQGETEGHRRRYEDHEPRGPTGSLAFSVNAQAHVDVVTGSRGDRREALAE